MILLCAATNDAWSRGDELAAIALCIGVVAAVIAWRTLWCSNLNASVATSSVLIEGIQSSLYEYINSIEGAQRNEEKRDQQAEKLEVLMNHLEMASAVCVERSLYGISLTLVRNYLKDVLNLVILKNQYVCTEAGKLLQDEATFKYIRWFMDVAPKGSITNPDGWYVRYKPSFIEWLRVNFGLAGW